MPSKVGAMREADPIRLEPGIEVELERFILGLLEAREPRVLYEAAAHIIRAGGKRLRPYLVLRSCELVGGSAEAAIPFAAAVEVLHSFTLIHDDIMDNDELRRGVPTVHVKWGIPIAIASGDLLYAKVYEAAIGGSRGVPCEVARACLERITEATVAICEGQVLDISFPAAKEVSEEGYISMVGKKTAALFRACAEVGATVGGGTPDEVERLGSYAWDAGVAFQLVDDYLGLTADAQTLGKPVGSDLREGKRTLIIIHALGRASAEERRRIERVLGNREAPPGEVEEAVEVLRGLGSLDHALEQARRYEERAKARLSEFPDSGARRDLLRLVDYFVERTR